MTPDSTPLPEDDSVQLMAKYRSGDVRAAEEIFNRFVHRLTALAKSRLSDQLAQKLDAEDVVQSVYRSFFLRARDGHYTLEKGGDLWRLLASITVHKVLKKAEYYSADKRRLSAEQSPTPERSSAEILREKISKEPTPEDAAVITDELELLMESLSPIQQSILAHRLQGESVEAIAIELALSERHVRRTLQLIERRLLDRFNQQAKAGH